MSILIDKINSAEYIYSTNTKWGLKKYICDVAYFTEEPLDDLYLVICSILDSTENKCYDKRSLGVLLGFSLIDQGSSEHHDAYYDVAEVRLFEDLLAKVEQEHLIVIDDDCIILTELGRISIKEGKHYQFFVGTQEVYEHLLMDSDNSMALLMFPFYKDMGIYTTLNAERKIWPDDDIIRSVVYHSNSPLKKRLEYQSIEKANIYSAELQEYFDIETKTVPVKLFKYDDEYIPAIYNGDNIAVRATQLVNEEINAYRRENIILECLFQKLWDDKSAVLNYQSLGPYFDLVDYEELTKDSRTIWSDDRLFDIIVARATSTCWRNITRYCDIDILHKYIDLYKDNLDWPILTQRIDDTFLTDNFLSFPWDLEVISDDLNRKTSVLEQLILMPKETEEDWNWDALEQRLTQDFVLSHLGVVKVNLASYTNDSEDVCEAIIVNSDKRWDWKQVESTFNLQYILDNIRILGAHFNFTYLFDRIFTDSEWAHKFVCNTAFKEVIAEACKDEGALSSAIFNDKEYLWSYEIIDLLLNNELLCWQSTPYMTGFECNPNLTWTKDFFDRYSKNVVTAEGLKYVSSQISDIKIIIDAPYYSWNWDAISTNKSLTAEKQLFTNFGTKLNWSLVLENQRDAHFLESIDGIESMIANDDNAWTAFSSIASIEYVISKYRQLKFPWDWTVLTERMFKQLKLENLGNKLFVEKWDWTYLSEHVDISFLSENLEKYSKYWNWEVSLPRILTPDNRYDYGFLDRLAVILTNIPGKIPCQNAWTALTAQYSFKELKQLIKETVCKRAYWWDINYFCLHKDFYVFRDLDECRNIIDWNIISSSPAVDASFKFNPKLGIKEKAWHDEIRKVLKDERNRWNYKSLSHFESLRDERWFINLFKDKLDWNFLSQSSKLFCVKDKQELNEIIEAYKSYINFKVLSERDDVDIEQIIKINPRADYDYNKLIENGVVKATLQLVEEMPDYPWDWNMVTSSTKFYPTADFLLSHLDCEINWAALSKQDNKAWTNEELVLSVATNPTISKQIDWKSLSSLDYFPINDSILSTTPIDMFNWKRLSSRKAIAPYIDKYVNYIDWRVLSNNRHIITLDIDILEKYKDHLDWGIICRQEGFVFTNEILNTFAEYIDWNLASNSKDIKFSKQLVEKFKNRWNWPVLVKNKAFNNTVNISEMPYAKQINIVEFISKFPGKPKAYHFTHMDNAVKIIRTMKLQSRNYAEGNFSNSAGSNVHRTSKAHGFARFYFVPKSPTQFYNECLGKDVDDKYYAKAYNLGLPKCPLPVFFIFDIEELLTVNPDLCYYSNGNMQKDSSKCFKVTEEPNKIKASEIYINTFDTFDERQQEFLVKGELDFSKLKNVQICCYDEYQADMLRHELKGTKWEDIVKCNKGLYERNNKEIFYREREDSVTIDTDYRSPYELRVSYSGAIPPTINNKKSIIRQRGNNIYMNSSVDINKDAPFEVYFEVNNPRPGSWLIYRNI